MVSCRAGRREPHASYDHAQGCGYEPGARPGQRDQESDQGRAEDEEDLHADRFVGVGGVAYGAGREQHAPQCTGGRGDGGLGEATTNDIDAMTGTGRAASITAMASTAATPKTPEVSSSGTEGPIRSMTRPWSTDPQPIPTKTPAAATPAAANDPVSRWT